jgi:hypothetical protein
MLEEIDLFVCCCGQCDSVMWLWTVKHMVSAFALFYFLNSCNFSAVEAAGKLWHKLYGG